MNRTRRLSKNKKIIIIVYWLTMGNEEERKGGKRNRKIGENEVKEWKKKYLSLANEDRLQPICGPMEASTLTGCLGEKKGVRGVGMWEASSQFKENNKFERKTTLYLWMRKTSKTRVSEPPFFSLLLSNKIGYVLFQSDYHSSTSFFQFFLEITKDARYGLPVCLSRHRPCVWNLRWPWQKVHGQTWSSRHD